VAPSGCSTMMAPVLDDRDLEIIAALQEDARATYADVAGRVGIIRAGRMAAVETVERLIARSVRHVVATFAAPVDPAAFASLASVRDVAADGRVLRMRVEGSFDGVVKALAPHEVLDLTIVPADLEEIFLGFYQGGDG